MVSINNVNMNMIMDIMNGCGRKCKEEQNTQYTKYTNSQFEIIVKNNSSIVVFDKRGPVTRCFSDLKTAHTQIKCI